MTLPRDLAGFLEHIYDTSDAQTPWTTALAPLSEAFGAQVGHLFQMDARILTQTPRVVP